MKTLKYTILLPTLVIITLCFNGNYSKQNDELLASAVNNTNGASCTAKGIKLYGKVKIVNGFADLKIQYVKSFPDIKVKFVESFPDECGEWEIVSSFPDFTVQVVESFPDIKVQIVNSFSRMD